MSTFTIIEFSGKSEDKTEASQVRFVDETCPGVEGIFSVRSSSEDVSVFESLAVTEAVDESCSVSLIWAAWSVV